MLKWSSTTSISDSIPCCQHCSDGQQSHPHRCCSEHLCTTGLGNLGCKIMRSSAVTVSITSYRADRHCSTWHLLVAAWKRLRSTRPRCEESRTRSPVLHERHHVDRTGRSLDALFQESLPCASDAKNRSLIHHEVLNEDSRLVSSSWQRK